MEFPAAMELYQIETGMILAFWYYEKGEGYLTEFPLKVRFRISKHNRSLNNPYPGH
jgi:hypothetical protein